MNNAGYSSVDKVRTTIGVKLATKYLILKNSLPGESHEDTIVRIIHENRSLSFENSRLLDLIKNNNISIPNLLIETKLERGSETLELPDGTNIHYSYNIPSDISEINSEYTMDIVIEKVVIDGKECSFTNLSLSHKDRIILMMNMIEKVINLHFDRGFKLPEKTFLIDPQLWRKVYSRVGLSDSSYLNDIMRLVREYESGSDE